MVAVIGAVLLKIDDGYPGRAGAVCKRTEPFRQLTALPHLGHQRPLHVDDDERLGHRSHGVLL
jgi:hypothetical protein